MNCLREKMADGRGLDPTESRVLNEFFANYNFTLCIKTKDQLKELIRFHQTGCRQQWASHRGDRWPAI